MQQQLLEYTAIAVREDDGRYSVIVPDLIMSPNPIGLGVWGHILEEAVESAKDGLDAVLTDILENGEALPEPNKYTTDMVGLFPPSKEKNVMIAFQLYFQLPGSTYH